jgi:hypothetical protein
MYFNTLFLDAVAVSNYTTPNGLVMDELWIRKNLKRTVSL